MKGSHLATFFHAFQAAKFNFLSLGRIPNCFINTTWF
jgi:hypothetical protein